MTGKTTPKGKTFGTMAGGKSGVEGGLSEVSRFDPAASGVKSNATSQRPLPEASLHAGKSK